MNDISGFEPAPVFFDATGRRASVLRRGTQLVGILLLGYVVLFAAAVIHAPGAARVSLPGVGRLFPETQPTTPPRVDSTPIELVHTSGGASSPPATRAVSATTAGTTATTSVAAHPVPAQTPATRGRGTTPGTQGSTPASSPPATSGSGSTPRGQGPSGSGPPGQQVTHGNGQGRGNGHRQNGT